MTSTAFEGDLSVGSILFGQAHGAERTHVLSEALTGMDVARSKLNYVRRLSTAVLGAVDQQIGEVAEGMLFDIGLGRALADGWSKHAQLRGAARRTLSTAGSEVVALAEHQVTSGYHPVVELVVDRKVVGSVEFEVRLVFDVTALAAVVRGGSLVAVRGGDVKLTATLLLYGETLAQRPHTFDPELVVRLDPPLVLAVTPAEV